MGVLGAVLITTACTGSIPLDKEPTRLPEALELPCRGVSDLRPNMAPLEQERAWRSDREALVECSQKHQALVELWKLT